MSQEDEQIVHYEDLVIPGGKTALSSEEIEELLQEMRLR